ncbi:PP2C family protein-serine/threonine phosphatase [Humisphaera borealis]|uniref:PP2C family protein-serine/threonine phosphatase n=1 Tax=Humisphaera borealis TaxID=2807512 RepID=A0A7M2WTC6_9BACT|nr:PP2C family protein-serine/threonine phosphatase [Humisphaera borealis]QOV88514.1 PP2C family protein-serine/threonine phosphatase [Humisphaera borealis]
MLTKRRPWKEELAIIDRAMHAISGVTDPEELVSVYWRHIGELVPIKDYVAISRRHEPAPYYVITRSSRFTKEYNPWTQRHLLPRFSGGLLGEIAYANTPIFIDDLPARLKADDPARFYLEGYQSMIALPQYDAGEGLNVTMMLLPKGLEIDPAVIPVLHWQSGLFGRGTQNLVLRNQLEDALSSLDRELQAVGAIQRSLLPGTLPTIPGVQIAAFYQTSARAGGDYYDFFPLSDGTWGIFIADVAGHGTPAAVLMAITHALAHSQPHTHTPPEVLLAKLNNQLTRSYTQGGTFVTAFYAVLDPVTRTLTYCSAGHNPPRLVRGDMIDSLDLNGGLPLGILEDQPYTQAVVSIDVDDLLLLYTDGVTEAYGPVSGDGTRDLFGVERLDAVLKPCRTQDADSCIERIKSAVIEFCRGSAAADDQTLIAMRFRQPD